MSDTHSVFAIGSIDPTTTKNILLASTILSFIVLLCVIGIGVIFFVYHYKSEANTFLLRDPVLWFGATCVFFTSLMIVAVGIINLGFCTNTLNEEDL